MCVYMYVHILNMLKSAFDSGENCSLYLHVVLLWELLHSKASKGAQDKTGRAN